MSTHKRIDAICIGIVLCTLLLTLLFLNGRALGITVASDADSADGQFTENDLDADWDAQNATQITLDEEKTTVHGNGAYVQNGTVYIVSAGKYRISGTLSDGQILISAHATDKIWLLLDGVSVHCDDSAALCVTQAGKVFLTLADGTENTLSSGDTYSAQAVSENIDGAIYARDDLTVNGSGALTVTAPYRHGIVCNDDLVFTGGTINVTAARDAVHANDSVRVRAASLTLSGGSDGISAANEDETAYLYLASGDIHIPTCREGLEAAKVTIAGGTVDITPTDDGINANGSGKASEISITGGDITITSPDGRDADGIDSNGNIFISGGRLFISVSDNGSSAIDCGSESGGVCKVSGGTILACGSSSMAEGFDSDSAQGFLMRTVSATAGTTVTARSTSGATWLSETVPCGFSSVLISTPEMKVGDSCTLTIGETEEAAVIDNQAIVSGIGGRMRGGAAQGGDGSQLPALPDGQTGMPGQRPDDQNGTGDDTAPTLPDGQTGTRGQRPDDQNGTGDATAPALPNGQTGMPGQRPDDQNSIGGDTATALPDGQTGTPGQRPDDQSGTGDATTPTLPDGQTGMPGQRPDDQNSTGGDTAPALPDGQTGMPGQRPDDQNGTGGDTTPTLPDGQTGMPGQASPDAETAPSAAISASSLLLLGISAVVLLAGCIIAFLFRRRSHR